MRIVNLLLVSCLLALAFVIYNVKYDTRELDARISALRLDIEKERDAIAILRAEWGHLNSPARIERLARKHLGLKPVQSGQMVPREQLSAVLLNMVPAPVTGENEQMLRQPVNAVR